MSRQQRVDWPNLPPYTVPISSVAPNFKLTLPSRNVEQYLSHLIKQDFEIVSDLSASSCWTVTLIPRQCHNSTEYFLQGWRLLAEALKVKPGDQVCFDVVSKSRLRLTVQRNSVGRVLRKSITHSPQTSSCTSNSNEDTFARDTKGDDISRECSFADGLDRVCSPSAEPVSSPDQPHSSGAAASDSVNDWLSLCEANMTVEVGKRLLEKRLASGRDGVAAIMQARDLHTAASQC